MTEYYKESEKENRVHRDTPPKKRPTRKMKLRPKTPLGPDGTRRGSEIPPPKRALRNVLLWLMITIGFIALAQVLTYDQKAEVDVTFSEFQSFLNRGLINEAKVIDNEFRGVLLAPTTVMRPSNRGIPGDSTTITIENGFKVILPNDYVDADVIKKWDEAGLKYEFQLKSIDWSGYLLQLSPWIIIVVFWFYIMRRMQGTGTKGIFSFGKSKARVLTGKEPKITFMDVAGVEEAKQELQEIIEFLKNPAKFCKLGGKIPKGVLLLGPPGTGKTLLARAIAGEAGVPFFSISGADFVEMFVGVGASRVRDLFEQGKKNAPCIVFIDELDAVGRMRGAGLGGGHDEREQTLNQLLVEMDGFDTNEGVILLAATNRPDVLDRALLRPGRFDRQVVVDNPDVRGREGILKVHAREVKVDKTVDMSILAKGTPGLSGADLANLVNEAALLAARKGKKSVQTDDFEEAKDKVMMGVERKSLIISDRDKRVTAYHEAGHALVASLIPDADPIHKVTIIPRGRALGVTHQLPIDEKYNYSKTLVEAQLAILLAGRVAEYLSFGEYTTGAGNDLERATELARKMVCEWGMSNILGPLTFGKKDEEIFLGREIATHRDYSEKTAQEIDKEVKNIILRAEKRSNDLLSKSVDAMNRIAETLLEKEIIDSSELKILINGELLPGNGETDKEDEQADSTKPKKRSRVNKPGRKKSAVNKIE